MRDQPVPTDKPSLYLTIDAGDLAYLKMLHQTAQDRRLISRRLTLNQWVRRLALERARQLQQDWKITVGQKEG